MKRALATILMAGTVAVSSPAAASAANSTTVSQLSSTAPSRLYTPKSSSDLPYTGMNLLPETLLGIGLIGAGVTLRVRQRS